MEPREVCRIVDNLSNQLSEVLDCFVILGFDFNGEPYTCVEAATYKDKFALLQLLNNHVKDHRFPLKVQINNEEE
jgi:hypothetical protein